MGEDNYREEITMNVTKEVARAIGTALGDDPALALDWDSRWHVSQYAKPARAALKVLLKQRRAQNPQPKEDV